MTLAAWQHLQPGDIVDIIAPGYGTGADAVEQGAAFIRSLGLTPRVPETLMGHHRFSSNTDEARLQHTINALTAPDSKAVWCLKGGFGTTLLMPELLKLIPPPTPKLLMGFSDISALHLLLNNHWGWASLHAPVLWQIATRKINDASIQALTNVLLGKVKELHYELVILNEVKDIKQREILRCTQNDTVITGGNMAILQTSLGTPWQMQTQGRILFMEEVDEKPYRVSRMLGHFAQAGMFDAPAAVIFGDLTIEEPFREDMESVVTEFAAQAGFPVYRLRGIGHEVMNLPLPLGTKTSIAQGKLTVATGAAQSIA